MEVFCVLGSPKSSKLEHFSISTDGDLGINFRKPPDVSRNEALVSCVSRGASIPLHRSDYKYRFQWGRERLTLFFVRPAERIIFGVPNFDIYPFTYIIYIYMCMCMSIYICLFRNACVYIYIIHIGV